MGSMVLLNGKAATFVFGYGVTLVVAAFALQWRRRQQERRDVSFCVFFFFLCMLVFFCEHNSKAQILIK